MNPAAEPPPARILIVGAGAVGQYLAARLIAAGRDVTVLARPATAARLRRAGIVLRDRPAGVEEHVEVMALTPEDLSREGTGVAGRFDVVVVVVKSPGLDWAARALATPGLLAPHAPIVPLLNGMAQIEVLRAAPGALLGATIRIVASLADDGAVVLHQPLHRIAVGSLADDDSAASPRVRAAADALAVPGVDVAVSPDVARELWEKWYFIVACGVLGVLARGTVGAIAAVPGGAEVVDAVLAETAGVSAAAGYPVRAADLEGARSFLTAPGSGFVSSLYRDVVAGRAGESEHIVGDFVRRAREAGVATPLCDAALLQMRIVTT